MSSKDKEVTAGRIILGGSEKVNGFLLDKAVHSLYILSCWIEICYCRIEG